MNTNTNLSLFCKVFTLVFSAALQGALAQSNFLDPTFGNEGKVITSIGPFYSQGLSIAIQTDGKIIACGTSPNINYHQPALARYKLDGSLDETFGINGIVVTDLDYTAIINSLVVQPDGKILASGFIDYGTDEDFLLMRYNSDGSLDSSFHFDGMVTTSFGFQKDQCNSMCLQSDGRIVLAGTKQNYNGTNADVAIARYNSDGTLDTGFAGDGKLMTDFGGTYDNVWDIILQSDEKILVTGLTGSGSTSNMFVARYHIDGYLDTTFNGTGIHTPAFSGNQFSMGGTALALHKYGKILVAGNMESNLIVMRILPNGKLDSTFGVSGYIEDSIEISHPKLAVGTDGRIIVTGSILNSSGNSDFGLALLDASGSTDISFGNNGIATADFGDNDYAHDVAVQTDGKILVFGEVATEAFYASFGCARFLSPPALGIESNSRNEMISIFPNPCVIPCKVICSGVPADAELCCLSLYGEIIEVHYSHNDQTLTILPDDLPSGLYFLRVASKDEVVSFEKLVIVNE